MTTVLTVGNSEGSRSCNATCHDARRPKCDCVCRGRYHGCGTANVLAQVQADVEAKVYGDVARIETQWQLAQAQRTDPSRVRFHAGEVRRAIRSREAKARAGWRRTVEAWVRESEPECPSCGGKLDAGTLSLEQFCSCCGVALDVTVDDVGIRMEVAS